MPLPMTPHEDRVAEDLVALIDYAGRVLIAASFGSPYQLDKAHDLRDAVDRLIARLEGQTLDTDRGPVVAAGVARAADRYTLGRVLLDVGRLGGTA